MREDQGYLVLLDTRRSLPDACTNSLDILGEPARFGPPGDACIDEGLDNLGGAFGIITGSFSFPDDIKGRREGAMCLDIGFMARISSGVIALSFPGEVSFVGSSPS